MLIIIEKGLQESFLLADLCAFRWSQPSPEVANLREAGVTRAGSVISWHFSHPFQCWWDLFLANIYLFIYRILLCSSRTGQHPSWYPGFPAESLPSLGNFFNLNFLPIIPSIPCGTLLDLIEIIVASPTGSEKSSRFVKGRDVSWIMASMWKHLHAACVFIRVRARRRWCRIKLAEVGPPENTGRPLVTVLK